MKKLSWVVALAVFLLFFGVYSFRLGILPQLMHDAYEYTYPSFSLAERGSLGSPLVGPGFNVENRTYSLIIYRNVTVHAVLIRLFGEGPESIPLAEHPSRRPAGRSLCLLPGAPASVPGPVRLPVRARERRAHGERPPATDVRR